VSRVLAFRHVPFEHLGLIADALAAHGVECRYVDLYESPRPPGVEEGDGLIFMGGPMSVNDDLPYLREEVRIIQEATARNIPVLGVCLGSQLIARALGSSVYRNPVKEIGWYPVQFTESAAEDGMFEGLAEETVFHWHGETFDLPRGAELLASSAACRHQAYRVGTNVYGLQFHLEVTPEMIVDWCTQDANCGDMREMEGTIDPEYNRARFEELSRMVFGRWCGVLADAAAP
jgi:GMP synthase-like glutamine amidotransferase